MKNYIIPYMERFIQLAIYSYKRSIVCVDNIGMVVNHAGNPDLSDENIRRHLTGIVQRTILIQANDIFGAISKFNEFEEAKTGEKYKAWTIETDEINPIIEYANCPHIRVNNSIACAYYDEPEEHGYMICVLDGLDDPPRNCPISQQIGSEKFTIHTVDGYYVKTF
jgi:hypothetical protein